VEHLYFGPARRLFGTLERAPRLQPRSAAVLLCNPFGEEAVRAHRIYRVLASELAREGYASLRFDYSATGDSLGDGDEARAAAWLDDVASAAAELRGASGARHLVAFGLRLGGTLAALATARRGLALRHLVLWDPVVDGAAYLRDLAALHRQYMHREMAGTAWQDRLALSAEGFPAEALGAPIPAPLAAELAAVDLAAEPLRAAHVTVVATKDGPGLDRLKARVGALPLARWIEAASTVPWNSDDALNAALVPMDVVRRIAARIAEVSP
jgi:pimeloyl-ACP methyl ester carboxylesterase